jgi:ribosome-associated toxin RatA of RatAB toxin-antitoxin module
MSNLSDVPLANFDLASEAIASGIESHPELTASQAAVQVQTDLAEGGRRHLSARIQLPYARDQIWVILTDYDHLADFIPGLARSCRIPHPDGGIRLEQVGSQSLLKLKFCARVVLDMVEQMPNRLDFQMVEGDFREFSGSWVLEPASLNGRIGTELLYSIRILPPRVMPTRVIEGRLHQNLQINLNAIRERADALFGTPD